MTAIESNDWGIECWSCETESTGFGPFAFAEARLLADTHNALQHRRQPNAAVLAAAEHVETADSRSAGDTDEDGWF